MTCKTLLFAALFAVTAAWGEDQASSRRPDGTGDPDATTCRPPQPLPGARVLGPKVCKTNSQWALLRKNNQDISSDGSEIIPDKSAGATMNCTSTGGGASNGGGMTVCH